MGKLLEKAYFNIDDSDYFEGYYYKESHWNGWAMPMFEKEIANLLIQAFSVENDFEIVYDKYTDCYICKTIEDDVVIQTDIAEKVTVNTKEGIKEVYDFGSIGWTWNDYNIEEIKDKHSTNRIIKKEKYIDLEY